MHFKSNNMFVYIVSQGVKKQQSCDIARQSDNNYHSDGHVSGTSSENEATSVCSDVLGTTGCCELMLIDAYNYIDFIDNITRGAILRHSTLTILFLFLFSFGLAQEFDRLLAV